MMYPHHLPFDRYQAGDAWLETRISPYLHTDAANEMNFYAGEPPNP